MKKTLMAATALLLLGTPLAFAAATATPSAQCATLEQQFSHVEQSHKSMKAFGQAAKLRDEGRSLCMANKAPDGVKKLEQALKLIGVTPEVKG